MHAMFRRFLFHSSRDRDRNCFAIEVKSFYRRMWNPSTRSDSGEERQDHVTMNDHVIDRWIVLMRDR